MGLVLAIVLLGFAVAYNPLIAVGGVAAAVVFMAFALRVEYFVGFIALYTPLEEFALKWLPQEMYAPARYASEALLIVLFLVAILKNLLNRKNIWKRTPLDLPLLALVFVITASALVNDVPPFIAALGVKNLLRYALLYYIVINSDLSDGFWKKLVFALLVLCFAEGVLGIVQYIVGEPAYKFLRAKDVEVGGMAVRELASTDVGKVFGTMGRYNLLGNFLNFFMVMAMGLYYTRRENGFLGYALFFMATLAGLVLTFSRMSWFGLYLGFMLILLIQKRKIVIIYLLLPIFITLALVGAYEGLNWYKGETKQASAIERYVSIFTSGYITKARRFDRLFALLVTAPAAIEKYPMFGLGPGTFASEVVGSGTHEKGLYPEHSHADWLELNNKEAVKYTSDQGWTVILCQLGLTGLICVVWVFVVLIRRSYLGYKRARDPFEKGVLLGFLGCIFLLVFQNFVSFNLTYRAVSLYFWLFAGYAVSWGAQRSPAIEGETAG